MTESPASNDDPVNLNDLIAHVLLQHPSGDSLQHLQDAVALSQRLDDAADHLIGHFVDEARTAGASWTDIGANLGVSKQAAQKRFVPKDGEDLDFPERGPLSRFTPRARTIVKNAKSQTAMLGLSHVSNEMLLLGLLTEPEGLAAQAIIAAGKPLDQLRDDVLATQKKSRRRALDNVRFSRETKKTLELALRTALSMNHNYIGTEHLLIGILRQPKDPATLLLANFGMTLETTEAWVTEEIARIVAARKAG
jgi:hypothetical protein